MGQSIQELDQVKFVEDNHITLNFLKAVFHKYFLVHSWIVCSIWNSKYQIIFFYIVLTTMCKKTSVGTQSSLLVNQQSLQIQPNTMIAFWYNVI